MLSADTLRKATSPLTTPGRQRWESPPQSPHLSMTFPLPPKPSSGPEYDVIDRSGKLVDRLVLPAGTTIVGFAPGGIVYLGVRDASGVRVVRARER